MVCKDVCTVGGQAREVCHCGRCARVGASECLLVGWCERGARAPIAPEFCGLPRCARAQLPRCPGVYCGVCRGLWRGVWGVCVGIICGESRAGDVMCAAVPLRFAPPPPPRRRGAAPGAPRHAGVAGVVCDCEARAVKSCNKSPVPYHYHSDRSTPPATLQQNAK